MGAGLPRPELQVHIATEEGDAYPDFLWAGARVIGEVDGAVKYKDPQDLVKEKRRQESLERMGFLFVRWMADDVHVRPRSIIQRLAWALDSRA
jgi:very-short-patch-repair endonuclease